MRGMNSYFVRHLNRIKHPSGDLKIGGGFTLVEMLVTMTVVAIIAAVGVPSYKYVTTANRISAEANGLLGDLQLARAEAVKQGLPVTACVSSDGATCTGGTAWQGGWIVFSDSNGNAQVNSATEAVLKVQKSFIGSDQFNANNSVTAVTFNREGLTIGIAAGTQFILQDANNTIGYRRCLSFIGIGLMSVQSHGSTVNGVTCS
jgi:type IV fimbrial biogenesis protein FimT